MRVGSTHQQGAVKGEGTYCIGGVKALAHSNKDLAHQL